MSFNPLDKFRHEHVYLGAQHERNERRTWAVIALTTAMMALEVAGGVIFGSMALLADGVHMSTHAGAMLIAAVAYGYARKHARDERFSFGTGKVGDLAAFASAIVLGAVAVLVAYESVERLLKPAPIAYDEALGLAVVGLLVNLASAWLLKDDHRHHGYEHTHDHDHHHHDYHHHHHHDLNLRAAYVHVLADAAVSVLAIVGLLAGRELGWSWMDPLMGLVGFAVIANWSIVLLRAAGAVLLDMRADGELDERIRRRLELQGDHVTDLHVWRLGPGHYAAVVSMVSTKPLSPAAYKAMLESLPGLSHVTVEVHPWPG